MDKTMLSEHVIVEVKGGTLRTQWPRLIGKNGKREEHGYGQIIPVVTIKTNTGYTGWGIGHIERTLKWILEGKKVSEVFDPSIGILDKCLLAADFALHDLAGKILNIPVSKMMNPNSLMKASCYDGAIYLSDLTEKGDMGVEAVINDCKADFARGYTDFKVKIGRGKWMGVEEALKRDVNIIRQIRKEFPKSKILVDANDSMTLQTMIRFMDAVKDCDIYWIEEPFVENYDECMALKEYLVKNSPDTLIADGEFMYDTDLVIDLAKKGAIDCLLMDPESFTYTGWRKLINECKGTSIKCSPHCWGTKIKTNSVGHLAAAFPEVCPTIEGVPEFVPGVDDTGYEMKDGLLIIPEKSGFGMELEYAYPEELYGLY